MHINPKLFYNLTVLKILYNPIKIEKKFLNTIQDTEISNYIIMIYDIMDKK